MSDDSSKRTKALEQIADELGDIQKTLALIAKHLIGGLSPDDIEAARTELDKLKKSRTTLSAAIDAATRKP